MTPKERVLTTLSHKEPDTIPWGEHLIDYPVYEYILGRQTFVKAKFREIEALWDGRRDEVVASYKRDIIDLADALGLDIVLAPRVMGKNEPRMAMKKIDDATYEDENGNVWRISSLTHDLLPYKMNPDAFKPPTVESLTEEIEFLKKNGVPEPEESCWEVTRHIVKERGKTHFTVCFSGDVGYPSFGQTQEEFYINLLMHPEMHALLTECTARKNIAGLKYIAAQGVDGVITPGDLGTSTGPLANPKIYKQHATPWLKKYIEEAHRLGLRVFKHCCGCVWDFVDLFVEVGYDAYESIQTSAGMDIKILKERVGDRLTLWGGVSNESLIGKGPDAVADDARYAIKWGAPGGGFIYGASHSLAVGTKQENLMAMKKAREEWGTYPIKL